MQFSVGLYRGVHRLVHEEVAAHGCECQQKDAAHGLFAADWVSGQQVAAILLRGASNGIPVCPDFRHTHLPPYGFAATGYSLGDPTTSGPAAKSPRKC